jgi:outer membrane protein assembly factor BamB
MPALGVQRLLLTVVAFLSAASLACAEDWPQWRGPTGQGTTSEKNLPPTSEGGRLVVRWKTPLPGKGCSSPIVSQGRVYVTTAYEGQEPHPWDRGAGWLVITVAVAVVSLTLVRLPSVFRSLPPTRRMLGLAAYTGAVIALTALVLVKPQWFWQFSDPWSGTERATAELPFVEWLYLRPIIVLLVGSLVLIFAGLALQANRATNLEASARLSHWMALVTVGCTLASAIAAGLIAWQPVWFFQTSQPWLAWLVSGGVALGCLASGVGWLRDNSIVRLVPAGVGLALAGAFFRYAPSDQFTAELETDIRIGAVVPGLLLLIAHVVGLGLYRLRRRLPADQVPIIDACAPSSWFLAVLLPLLGGVLFARSNYLRPEVGLARAVVCVDADSGAMLWNTPVFVAVSEKAHAFNSHATPTPASDGERVYAYFGSGLAALDHNGRILWLNRDPDYHRHSRYGTGSSLALADDTLIVYQDSEYMGHGHHLDDDASTQAGRRPSALIAINTKSGKERWRVTPEFSHDSYMTPLIWTHDGEREVVIATWKTLASFRLGDGSLRWTHPYPMQQMVPSLAVHGDCLFVTGGNDILGPVHAVRPPSDGKPGKTVWVNKKGGAGMVSPVCWNGLLFSISSNGVLSCRNADTGKLHWSTRLRERFLGSLAAGDGKLFAVDRDGTLYVVAADTTGEVLAELRLNEPCAATVALANGHVFVRTADHLWCIGGAP